MSMYEGSQFVPVTSFRHGYGEAFKQKCDASPGPVNGPGAVQSFKDPSDINNIMRKFQRTGALEWASKHQGQYADVTGVTFENCMSTVMRAQEMFDDLPSSVRNRFQNSPAAFFEFMHEPGHEEELLKLGLRVAPAAPAPAAGAEAKS